MKYTAACMAVLSSLALLACSKQEASPAATPAQASAASATVAASAAAPDNAAGKAVYGKVCAVCHAAGVAGAPKPGDKADWAPRIAQGEDTLFKHALEGFTGAKGMMPARGGNASLSDDEVKSAVRHMIDASR